MTCLARIPQKRSPVLRRAFAQLLEANPNQSFGMKLRIVHRAAAR
jgi:hypothetical protein